MKSVLPSHTKVQAIRRNSIGGFSRCKMCNVKFLAKYSCPSFLSHRNKRAWVWLQRKKSNRHKKCRHLTVRAHRTKKASSLEQRLHAPDVVEATYAKVFKVLYRSQNLERIWVYALLSHLLVYVNHFDNGDDHDEYNYNVDDYIRPVWVVQDLRLKDSDLNFKSNNIYLWVI